MGTLIIMIKCVSSGTMIMYDARKSIYCLILFGVNTKYYNYNLFNFVHYVM